MILSYEQYEFGDGTEGQKRFIPRETLSDRQGFLILKGNLSYNSVGIHLPHVQNKMNGS
jgi:hypothetical protein